MAYRAVKIPLSCNLATVHRWADYMRAHMDEVAASLRQEGVRHEAWYLGTEQPLFVIGVMDVADMAKASQAAETSSLSVDQAHRDFKRHWIRAGITPVTYQPDADDPFPGYTLLFEARS